MWNVSGFCDDFKNKKVSVEEFKKIFSTSSVLRDFIFSTYDEVLSSIYKEEFVNNGGIEFINPIEESIFNFMNNASDEDVYKFISLLITYFRKIYDEKY